MASELREQESIVACQDFIYNKDVWIPAFKGSLFKVSEGN